MIKISKPTPSSGEISFIGSRNLQSPRISLWVKISFPPLALSDLPCFPSRLCTEDDFQKLPLNTPPEMQRSDLAASVLQLKALGIDNVVKFEFPSAPPSKVERGFMIPARDPDPEWDFQPFCNSGSGADFTQLLQNLRGCCRLLLQSGAAGCVKGFVTCFLGVPKAVGLNCSYHAAQVSKGNFQKTCYKTFYTTCRPRL